MKMKELEDRLLDLAKQAGAVSPTLDIGNKSPVVIVVDSETGRTWRIELREF